MKILFLSDFVPVNNLQLDDSFIKLVSNADKVFFNLEGSPLTGTNLDLQFQLMPFHIDEILRFLKRFGKDKFVVALANNHIFDNGIGGFEYLVKKLEEHNISYVGTKNIPYKHVNEKVTVLNFVTAETVVNYKCRKFLNLVFYSPSDINRQIQELEKSNRQLVLFPHWGRDMDRTIFNTYNLKYSKERWHFFGHHSHIISGICEKGIYSLGNTFIPHPYYYRRYPAMRYGLAVVFDSELQNYHLKLTSVTSNDGYEKDFKLIASSFNKIPDEILKHGENYSTIKKAYHKMLAFKGNSFDLIKLVILQVMSKGFELKRKLSNNTTID